MNRPDFPIAFDGCKPVFPGPGGKLGFLQCLASIPLFALCDERDPERERLKEAYYKEKKKKYDRIKAIYDKNCFVGTVFSGGGKVSARITKIAITETKAYVCYRASYQHIKDVEEENAKNGTHYLALKPGIYGLNTFLSAIACETIKIISIP